MANSFFTKEETKSDFIYKTPLSCTSCGLYKKVKSPNIKPYGKFKKKILIIATSPAKVDDRSGIPFQGFVGDKMQKVLKSVNINLFRDCLITFVCNCFTAEKDITQNNILCCRVKLLKIIKEYKPKVILLLGNKPVTSIIGKNWKKNIGAGDKRGPIHLWRGFQIPDREYNAWVCPVFDPSFIEMEKDFSDGLGTVIWKQDLKKAIACLDKKIDFVDEKKYITYIKTDKQFKQAYKRMMQAKLLSFDYEGTGLKPHAEGHQITNTSATINETECYSWMNTPFRNKLFKKILENPKIKKTAHNLSFEDMWSKVLLNTYVKGWLWCSMNNAHILDNRPGITSLKFQVYVNFGVADYDSDVNPYLRSKDDQGANSKNKILEFIKKYGEKPILTYCGLDSLYGYMLTVKQMRLIYGNNYRTKLL